MAGLFYRKGRLFGTTNGNGYGDGSVFSFDLKKSKLDVLFNFTSQDQGLAPGSGVLLRDSSGNLYGTTESGGTGNCSPYAGCGTVYELSPAAN